MTSDKNHVERMLGMLEHAAFAVFAIALGALLCKAVFVAFHAVRGSL